MVQPCCCMPLQRGVKVIAILSFLIGVAFIIEDVYYVIHDGCVGIQEIKRQYPEFGNIDDVKVINNNVNSTAPAGKNETQNVPEVGVGNLGIDWERKTAICSMEISDLVVSGVWIATWIGDLILAAMLLYGAFRNSIRVCSIWFHIRCALLVFRVIFLIIYIIAGLPIIWKIPVILMVIFRIYSLWLVSYFIDEISIEKEAKRKPRVSVASSKVDVQKYGTSLGIQPNVW